MWRGTAAPHHVQWTDRVCGSDPTGTCCCRASSEDHAVFCSGNNGRCSTTFGLKFDRGIYFLYMLQCHTDQRRQLQELAPQRVSQARDYTGSRGRRRDLVRPYGHSELCICLLLLCVVKSVRARTRTYKAKKCGAIATGCKCWNLEPGTAVFQRRGRSYCREYTKELAGG